MPSTVTPRIVPAPLQTRHRNSAGLQIYPADHVFDRHRQVVIGQTGPAHGRGHVMHDRAGLPIQREPADQVERTPRVEPLHQTSRFGRKRVVQPIVEAQVGRFDAQVQLVLVLTR